MKHMYLQTTSYCEEQAACDPRPIQDYMK